jgi:hypothetical protein
MAPRRLSFLITASFHDSILIPFRHNRNSKIKNPFVAADVSRR